MTVENRLGNEVATNRAHEFTMLRKRNLRRLALLGTLGAAAVTCGLMARGDKAAVAGSPAATPRSGMVALSGNLHPVARPERDLGRVDPSTPLQSVSLTFAMTAAQQADRKALLHDLQDPASPMFHQWLEPADVAARFGADPKEIARVSAWLTSQGFDVYRTSPLGMRIEFHATVGQVEQSFATEVHHYNVRGEIHYALSREPSVPAEFSGLVLGLRGVHDFRPKPPVHKIHPIARPEYPVLFPDDAGAFVLPSIGPADFAAIYDLNPLYAKGIDGTGQSIAIMGQTQISVADMAQYRATFGLPVNPVQVVTVPGGGATAVTGDVGEAVLDCEWSGTVAPGATIIYVTTGALDQNGIFDSMPYAIEEKTAPVMSLSYGGCESEIPANETIFNESYGDVASMEGITLVIASGDSSSVICEPQGESPPATQGLAVSYPASIPSVTAVGGSEFNLGVQYFSDGNGLTYPTLDGGTVLTDASATGYIQEKVWSDVVLDTWFNNLDNQNDAGTYDAGAQDFAGGGGGVSKVFAKPEWQVPYTPKDGFRDVPDVALSASADIMPYAIGTIYNGQNSKGVPVAGPWEMNAIGGTSAATPSFAGILALVNQAVEKANPTAPKGLGNANPMLYALANNSSTANSFHDITIGSNDVPCEIGTPDCTTGEIGYAAGPGYDCATGLGSIDGTNLVTAWSSLSPTSVKLITSTTTTDEGVQMLLTADVSAPADKSKLTGTVLFYVSTVDNQGNADLTEAIGSAAVVSTSDGTGVASLCTSVPGGFIGTPTVTAFYSGDPASLAAWSAPTTETICSTLQVNPVSSTAAVGGTVPLTATGGVPPYQWAQMVDNTCTEDKKTGVETCSTINDAGAITGGPVAGLVVVAAWDSMYAEQRVSVVFGSPTVTDAGLPPNDGGPISCPVVDAAGTCSDVPPAPTPTTSGSSKSNGCSCDLAGLASQGGNAGGIAGIFLGLAAMVGRRKQKRA